MPVKNAGSYLHECLSSIRGQTFPFWELLVVNDHSTDNSQAIIEIHTQEDPRINLLQNQGEGIIPALRMAFSHCQGDYVTRMDGDDVMPSNRLDLMIKVLSSARPKTVVTGKVKYFGEQEVSEGYQSYEHWLNERIDRNDHWNWVYRECVIASPNWMTRRQDLLVINAFDDLRYPEDYHLVLKWFEEGFTVKSIPEVTLLWREHPHRTSRNSEHYDQLHFFRLKVEHFVRQMRPQKLLLWGAGPKGRLTAQILDSLNVPFLWMDLNPEKYGKGINGHQVQHFEKIEEELPCQLLISVYPPEKEKTRMEKYLERLGLILGKSYWYL